MQMTLTQHGKDLLPLDPTRQSRLRAVSEVRKPEGKLLANPFVWPRINPGNHPFLHCGCSRWHHQGKEAGDRHLS